MKDKMRGFLGFLGLIEDDYGDYGTPPAPRPFSEQNDVVDDDEWARPSSVPPRGAPTTSRPAPRAGRPAPSQPRTSSISVLDASGQGSLVRPMAGPGVQRGTAGINVEREVAFFVPHSYDESRRITDLLRANRPVVLNVSEVDAGLARRLVDFMAGTAYALNAKIEVLASYAYLICPSGTHLGPEAKDRLRATLDRGAGEA